MTTKIQGYKAQNTHSDGSTAEPHGFRYGDGPKTGLSDRVDVFLWLSIYSYVHNLTDGGRESSHVDISSTESSDSGSDIHLNQDMFRKSHVCHAYFAQHRRIVWHSW